MAVPTCSSSTGSATRARLTVGTLVEALRRAGLAVDRAYGGRSVKAQWKAADRSGAALAVMVGRDELTRDAVAVKDLATGEQVEVSRADLVAWLGTRRDAERT